MHRLVLERAPVRVLDVQVQPGATSLYHLRGDPIFYVTINISEIDAQIMVKSGRGPGFPRGPPEAWRTISAMPRHHSSTESATQAPRPSG